MNRRGFLLGIIGAAAGGAALSTPARAAPAQSLWDELQSLDAAGGPAEDLPAEGAEEAQNRQRGRGRRPNRGRRAYGRRRAPRGRVYRRYRAPRRYVGPRRVCRLVRNRRGAVVRRCWRRW